MKPQSVRSSTGSVLKPGDLFPSGVRRSKLGPLLPARRSTVAIAMRYVHCPENCRLNADVSAVELRLPIRTQPSPAGSAVHGDEYRVDGGGEVRQFSRKFGDEGLRLLIQQPAANH